MRYLYTAIILLIASCPQLLAQSNLLESVKRNPQEAIALCNQLKDLNSQGISASSEQAIEQISKQRNLNTTDAEILSIYVIGLYCPEVN